MTTRYKKYKKFLSQKMPEGGKVKTKPDYTGMGIEFMNTPHTKYEGDVIGKQKASLPITNKQRREEFVDSQEFQNNVIGAVYGSSIVNLPKGSGKYVKDILNNFKAPKKPLYSKVSDNPLYPNRASIYRSQLSERNKGIEYLKNWYSDPIIKKRMGVQFDEMVKKPKDVVHYESIPKVKVVDKFTKSKLVPKSDAAYIASKNIAGVSNPNGKAYSLSRVSNNLWEKPRFVNPKSVGSTSVHEGAHQVYDALYHRDYFYNKALEFMGNSNNNSLMPTKINDFRNEVNKLSNWDKPLNKSPKDLRSYYTNPTEVNSRNMQIRYELNKTPSDIITKNELINYIIEKKPGSEMFDYIKPDDKYLDFLNKSFGASPFLVNTEDSNNRITLENEKFAAGGIVSGRQELDTVNTEKSNTMNIEKRTAKRALENIDLRLQMLSMEQQSLNNNKGGATMSKGGRVKMQDRGLVPGGGYTYDFSEWDKMFDEPYKIDFNMGNPIFKGYNQSTFKGLNYNGANLPSNPVAPVKNDYYTGVPKANTSMLPQTNQLKITGDFQPLQPATDLLPSNNNYLPKTGGTDWGGVANTAMGSLSTGVNALSGILARKADRLNQQEYQNPYASQALAMMPDQFRVDDMLNDNRNAYATYLRNVNQRGTSRGERLSGYTSGLNRVNEANTRAWAMKNNEENTMRTRKAMMLNDQGNTYAGRKLQVRDMNDANSAASRNIQRQYFSAAAEGLDKRYMVNKQMANQSASQQAYINALKQFGPYMSQWLDLDKYTNVS